MPSFVDSQYNKLEVRKERIDTFFADLEATLSNIGAPTTSHLDIYWDGSKVLVILTGLQISSSSLADKLKYYNQGLGLMKLAMNKQLYPV